MNKLAIGKDIFTVSGKVTNGSGCDTNANVGDVYKYIYIGDQLLQKTIVPHPLPNYLFSDQTQKIFVTKSRGVHIITAIETADGMKYAAPLGHLDRKSWVKVLPVFLLLTSPLSCAFGGVPIGNPGPIITLIVLASGFCYLAARSFGAANRAWRQVDQNVISLKSQLGA
jgi:hypothetical protein